MGIVVDFHSSISRRAGGRLRTMLSLSARAEATAQAVNEVILHGLAGREVVATRHPDLPGNVDCPLYQLGTADADGQPPGASGDDPNEFAGEQ